MKTVTLSESINNAVNTALVTVLSKYRHSITYNLNLTIVTKYYLLIVIHHKMYYKTETSLTVE